MRGHSEGSPSEKRRAQRPWSRRWQSQGRTTAGKEGERKTNNHKGVADHRQGRNAVKSLQCAHTANRNTQG